MKIAILGWGSLIWDPRTLKFDGVWRPDGPLFPIEFSRLSDGGSGRLTLTITPGANLVPTLWTFSAYTDLDEAIRDLAWREGSDQVGVWVPKENRFVAQREQANLRAALKRWHVDADAVIWTDLGPAFQTIKRRDFNLKHALEHLEGLAPPAFRRAAEYILRAPDQVVTRYRPALEAFIHDLWRTEGFSRPLLGPRAAEVTSLCVDRWDEMGLRYGQAIGSGPQPVWVDNLPAWLSFPVIGFSERILLELEVPFPRAHEERLPSGEVRWMFQTDHFEFLGEHLLMLGSTLHRIHHRSV